MKKVMNVVLALAMTLSTLPQVRAENPSRNKQERMQQLLSMAEQGGVRETLVALSDEELRQIHFDLRQMVLDLQVDLSVVQAEEDGRVAYKVRNYAALSVPTAILLIYVLGDNKPLAALLSDDLRFGIVSLGIYAILLGTTTAALSQGYIWLTPSEEAEIKEKIRKIVAVSDAIEAKLETR